MRAIVTHIITYERHSEYLESIDIEVQPRQLLSLQALNDNIATLKYFLFCVAPYIKALECPECLVEADVLKGLTHPDDFSCAKRYLIRIATKAGSAFSRQTQAPQAMLTST